MPLFSYKAITSSGEKREGVMTATDQAAVIAELRDTGLIPLEAREAVMAVSPQQRWLPVRSGKLGQKQVIQFAGELATLLTSGISLDRALNIMKKLSSHPRLSALAGEIQESVRGGNSLSAALEGKPQLFNSFFVSLVKSGELSGNLGEGLAQLASYLERSRALRERVTSAMLYPAILVVMTSLSLILVMVYVVPQFASLFDDMGAALPLSTSIVLGAADWLQTYGALALLLLIGVGVYFRIWLRPAENRLRFDRWCLRLPLLGSLLQKIDVARFSHSLGTLLSGGLPLLQAMPIARAVIVNQVLATAVATAMESLREGEGLAQPLIATGVFPELALQLVKVGEETGQLDSMLLRISTVYEREVDTAIQRLLTVIEPLLIVGLGVVIGGIIVSILAAIISINQLPM
ncbi:type II secretion system F family protein [Aestuariicella hydrocarbonica]|uniref:Type II secretion system F family protein n=1 Tax=Pseudomaricurvus hydrocarbonicus TaxID=1470433 RepID=A0A9E5MJX6_9GAMM|nr:type II secretion system F family protein [Aestuariicella hydrocarbonica]NHO65769.1 type II secretion system F family protein [Aestuariicella hydrocarbonica]